MAREPAGFQENFIDERTVIVRAGAAATFRAVCAVGGATGWHHGHWLWQMRGWMDERIGGPGLRRGRRDPRQLAPGDIVDFWHVSAIEEARRLELRADMRAPGDAWLTFTIEPVHARERVGRVDPNDASESIESVDRIESVDPGELVEPSLCRLTQTARFRPHGLAGRLYWYAVAPFHAFVFPGLLRGIAEAAERE